ncbi:hypothetical protein HELRODRAFT_178681 [Helobdella robusta]|uniref:RNA helicase n=1 Tax=Helobdella robusta TaxID=6412 RepID=T1FDK3_HELRO|nr:hypothetical protein HELRODRAFT_178681 [Helobdella robusta]ESN96881.1 hypothetical protein HELRODRAFT_178681 [Helobdella robusta]
MSEELCDFDDSDQIEIVQNIKDQENVSIHRSGFRDFLLKPELLRAINDFGFEFPSEIQNDCIPQAILGLDIICQTKSGMGKTAVFLLSTLQQIELNGENVKILVICHTRELAFQISKEFERFSKHMNGVRTAVFFGGRSISKDEETLIKKRPHIVVGTPGRLLALRNKKLTEMLEKLDYNQVIIFVKSVQRCVSLCEQLNKQKYSVVAIHRSMKQDQRLKIYQQFKNFESRIMVPTNLFGRGIDIERVNVVINYDVPEDSDTYLHRVARAGRFDTKGLAVTFLANEYDAETLNQVQERFEVNIDKMPDDIDNAVYF